jgi:ribulose-5-phosphate 4-epimerase/fuculose-1-phosphate aldolase
MRESLYSLVSMPSAMDELDDILSRLITAFHVLHQHRILDEHGHISVRHPQDPSTFFTSNVPAILVSSKNDLNQWNVANGSPVLIPYSGCQTLQTIPEFSEHYIHSCIYDHYPGVQSIVHSHCLSGIVYGLCKNSGSLLQPTYQMAGFLGSPNPIFDAADHYSALPSTFAHNLLINHKHLGDALAKSFSSSSEMDGIANLPDHGAVFQRGHGFVTWATSIEDAVYRAIHIRRAADIQTVAMAQRNDSDIEVVYLSEREARDCDKTINRTFPRTWSAWVAQAERSGQYQNELRIRRG